MVKLLKKYRLVTTMLKRKTMKFIVTVIGYGNDLRNDDGIGQRVANAIACWHLSTVKSLAVHQLTPELATTLANTELAIFVDACLTSENSQVQVQSLLPSCFIGNSSHLGDPRSLLALTSVIYGHCPLAYLVTVPGVNFELGDRLSSIAETGVVIALLKIIQLLDKGGNIWI